MYSTSKYGKRGAIPSMFIPGCREHGGCIWEEVAGKGLLSEDPCRKQGGDVLGASWDR